MEKIKLLSLVVPAYKQEKTIRTNIKVLKKVLVNLGIPYELIIVVDGFLDNTYKNAKKLESQHVVILGYKTNYGKGHAIQYGMLKARGDVIGFIDAGLDIDAKAIRKLLNLMMEKNADIVIGSKLHKQSKVNYPLSRKILSWGYRSLTKVLFGLSVTDTQVGAKFFRRVVVKKVFPRILVKAFAFDIEVLAVAHAFGYTKIVEGPINLNFNNSSSITSRNFQKIVSLMIWDTLAVFYRLKILHYYENITV